MCCFFAGASVTMSNVLIRRSPRRYRKTISPLSCPAPVHVVRRPILFARTVGVHQRVPRENALLSAAKRTLARGSPRSTHDCYTLFRVRKPIVIGKTFTCRIAFARLFAYGEPRVCGIARALGGSHGTHTITVNGRTVLAPGGLYVAFALRARLFKVVGDRFVCCS